MLPSQVIWDSPLKEEPTQHKSVKRNLTLQRGLTTLIVSVLIVSLLVGGSVYNTYMINITSTQFIYTSPPNGEQIQVGKWYAFDIDIPPPYPGLINMIGIHVDFLTWGNASSCLSFYIGNLGMNSTEFWLLNESDRLVSLVGPLNMSSEHCGGGFGLYETLEDSFGSYVCAFIIVSNSNPLETSYIDALLTVIYQCI